LHAPPPRPKAAHQRPAHIRLNFDDRESLAALIQRIGDSAAGGTDDEHVRAEAGEGANEALGACLNAAY
jgi:hypothetical protein